MKRTIHLPLMIGLSILLCHSFASGCAASSSAARDHASVAAQQLATSHARQRAGRSLHAAERSTLPDREERRQLENEMLEAAETADWNRAESLALLLLHARPAHERATSIQVQSLYFGRHRSEEAAAAAQDCVAAHPRALECYEVLAFARYDGARDENALLALTQLLELNPAHRRAHELLGRTLIALHRYHEAAEHLQTAVHEWPERMQLRILLATALERAESTDRARQAWRRVADVHRDRIAGLHYLRAFHERQGNDAEVRRIETEIAQLTPTPQRRNLDPL